MNEFLLRSRALNFVFSNQIAGVHVRADPGKSQRQPGRLPPGVALALAVVCDFRHWIQYPGAREHAVAG
jgi:hypothetical protein